MDPGRRAEYRVKVDDFDHAEKVARFWVETIHGIPMLKYEEDYSFHGEIWGVCWIDGTNVVFPE